MSNENQCFICGDSRTHVLETHHIVPRRYGGSDEDENLVRLCASCHNAVERLYDNRFYEELGVKSPIDSVSFHPLDSIEDLEQYELYIRRDTCEIWMYDGDAKQLHVETVDNAHEFKRIGEDIEQSDREVRIVESRLKQLIESNQMVDFESEVKAAKLENRLSSILE